MNGAIGRLPLGVAGAALIGLLVAPLPQPVGHADPEVPSGPYALTAHNPKSQRTATWTFTPCGPACTTLNADGWLQDADFHLNGGRWEYTGQRSMDCPATHRPLPISKAVSFDAVSLAGTWVTTTLEPCGRGPAGGVVGQWDFQLTHAG